MTEVGDAHESRATARPQSSSLPTGVRIVDAAVHVLAEEAQGIRDAEVHELPTGEREERLTTVGHADRLVGPSRNVLHRSTQT